MQTIWHEHKYYNLVSGENIVHFTSGLILIYEYTCIDSSCLTYSENFTTKLFFFISLLFCFQKIVVNISCKLVSVCMHCQTLRKKERVTASINCQSCFPEGGKKKKKKKKKNISLLSADLVY